MTTTEWIILTFILLALTPFWRRVYGFYQSSVLQKKGVRASAKVIRVEETGEQYRDGPVVMLYVEYSTPSTGVLQSSFRGMLTYVQLQVVKPGVAIDICYDPNEPSRFVLADGT